MAIINGDDRNNKLHETTGNDEIYGFGGDDTIYDHGNDYDNVFGGSGFDSLVINYAETGEEIITRDGDITANDEGGGYDGQYFHVSNGAVSFTSIERFDITTGWGADRIATGDNNDIVRAGDGNDTIRTKAGDDLVDAGAGDDIVDVGIGKDKADGGAGLDVISLDFFLTEVPVVWDISRALTLGGRDIRNFEAFGTVIGGLAGDTFITGRGAVNETINGFEGDDTIAVFGGADTVIGGHGRDTLILDYRLELRAISNNPYDPSPVTPNQIDGGFNGSFLYDNGNQSYAASFTSIERFEISTGSGADTITTADGDDLVKTGAGDDWVDVAMGADIADGGAGNDTISSDLSALTTGIRWDLEKNIFRGLDHSFKNFEAFGTIKGGSAGDLFVTGKGTVSETVSAAGGDDAVTVFGGADSVSGGAGSDTLILDYATETRSIWNNPYAPSPLSINETEGGYDGGFVYDFSNQSYAVGFSSIERFEITTGSGDDGITTGDGNDVVATSDGDDGITSGAGKDMLDGGAGDDRISGGDGNDTLTGGVGDDLLDGGVGIDTARYAGTSEGVRVDLRITGEQDTGGAGHDMLVSIENLAGSNGADTLTGNDLGNTLAGGSGRDTLSGGGGADHLIGGSGADLMTGGEGRDFFVFMALNEIALGDRVEDLSHQQHDVIDLSELDADPTLAGVQHFSFIGLAAFSGGPGYELRYQAGATAGDLTVQMDTNHDGAADFAFTVHAPALDASDFILTAG